MGGISRRGVLQTAVAGVMGSVGASLSAAAPESAPRETNSRRGENEPFGYGLNTSTLRGQKLGLVQELEIASQVGYEAVEPWLMEIDKYVQEGGKLSDLKKRIADLGLTVASAIGFAPWIADNDEARAQGLEAMRRDMDRVAQIGGTRIAAPPAGASDQTNLDLKKVAARYRDVLRLGEQMGVVPQLELWGFSKTLSRLSEVTFVAQEAAHRQACLLLDVYHLYKGGSDFAGLRLLSGGSLHCLHMNDFPADPPRETIKDEHRVFPGDGVAPLRQILRDLRDAGFRGVLSLELFNKDYWNRDAQTVAKMGLDKMKLAVRAALEEK